MRQWSLPRRDDLADAPRWRADTRATKLVSFRAKSRNLRPVSFRANSRSLHSPHVPPYPSLLRHGAVYRARKLLERPGLEQCTQRKAYAKRFANLPEGANGEK